jgi:hypothetical protein
MRVKPLTLLACLSLSLSCTSEPASGQSLRLLFIGNSYTYVNDLPAMVDALADSAGVTLEIESVTFGGVSLEDHWNEGTAAARLASQRWDVVVLQQGPSSLPESRVNLLDYATRFDKLIRAAGGRPAFYSVWPEQARMEAYDAARESYTIAADSLHAMLFPASEAWRAAWRKDASLGLYGPDGLHPSEMGTYLVALVMVAELTGKAPATLADAVTVGGASGYIFSAPPGLARLLKEAAGEANTEFGRR